MSVSNLARTLTNAGRFSRRASTRSQRPVPYNPPSNVSLSPGTRVGPYEVTAQLGAGGRGEMYRGSWLHFWLPLAEISGR
jgi:hypothetical protein